MPFFDEIEEFKNVQIIKGRDTLKITKDNFDSNI